VTFARRIPGYLIAISGLIPVISADPAAVSASDILARVENQNIRRDLALKQYSASGLYTLRNQRLGKLATVNVLVKYREDDGRRYTVLNRSGSDKLNGIIDKVIASERAASLPPQFALHQMNSSNYRVRLLGTEAAMGRTCHVLELIPKIKNRYLISGKAWVDSASYSVVRIEGRFGGSVSILVGAPDIIEEYVEVQGFWLVGRVRSVTGSLLLGPSELEILLSNYRVDGDSARPQASISN
jgi:hypothetical protein